MEYTEIVSPVNRKVKEAVKLRDAGYRRKTNLFLIDGEREIGRAATCGIEFLQLFVVEAKLDSAEAISRNRPVESIHLVSDAIFEKIAFGRRREGMIAVARTPERSPERFEDAIPKDRAPLLAVLEGVEKPGNVGAVFRSADGAGLDGVMITDPLSDLFNPNTIRSSLGTVFHLPAVCRTSVAAIQWLRDHGIGLATARCDGAVPYTEYDFRRPTAIVLGGEAAGLSELWSGPDVTAVSLPMHGIADSLNVSNAAAVLFYEARRRRMT